MEKLLMYLLLILLVGVVVMCCWNWVLVDLFNIPRINLWQSILLHTLTQTLFTNTSISTENK
jgi:hypothetical protein